LSKKQNSKGEADESKGRNYWHGAFYQALQLEFHEYRDVLSFESEHQLSKEALEIDVLIVKKDISVQIEKNIGKIFRVHNIVEFKSENDYLSIADYNKVIGYALIYAAFNKADREDITVSFSLTKLPKKLMTYLKKNLGYSVKTVGDGIYHIHGDTFPIQILEHKKLSSDDNLFLKNLGSNVTFENLVATIAAFTKQQGYSSENIYLQRLIEANRTVIEEVENMSEAVVKEILLGVAEKNGWLSEIALNKNMELAKKLLLDKVPVEKISEYTGLSVSVIKQL